MICMMVTKQDFQMFKMIVTPEHVPDLDAFHINAYAFKFKKCRKIVWKERCLTLANREHIELHCPNFFYPLVLEWIVNNYPNAQVFWATAYEEEIGV